MLRDFKKARTHTRKFIAVKDSIFSDRNAQAVADLEVKYDTEKKEKEILMQRADLAEKELTIQKKNYQMYGLLGLALILGLIGYLFYNQQKLKNKQLQKENELKDALIKIETQNRLQEQRLRISRDLHDNIGAQLTFIISSIDNLKYGFDIKDDKLTSKLNKISAFTSETIYELRDTIWAMNKNEITFEDLQSRISNYIDKAHVYDGNIKFSFVVDDSVNQQKTLTSIEGMNIHRIIQEAIHNSLKHASASDIKVRITQLADQLKITISDNGKGFQTQSSSQGSGLTNMNKRAKNIGGEIQVTSIEYAKFLKDRGYVVDPNPYDPIVEKAFKSHGVTSFARHSRLGNTNLDTEAQVKESFMESVAYLRKIGYKRISLKTGAYGMEELAMAIKYASEAKLDLLTIDGAGGGTGMSPWNMMEHWGVPSLPLHAKAYEYCKILEANGEKVPDISFAGGFAREDHIFKAIALGAPYTKLVCMGRAPMIPGYLGSNIQGVFQPDERTRLNGHWDELPSTIKDIGQYPEEIFSGWEAVKDKVGESEMKNIPFGAIAMYGYADKLAAGLQQFMAGARKFSLKEISRDELYSNNRETAKETGIPYVSDIKDDIAKKILKS